MSVVRKPAASVEPEPHYPASDGQPLGETEFHIDAIFLLWETLKSHFRRKPVYFASDMFLYYEQGNPRAVKAPDVMAIKDVPKHKRRIFKAWEENTLPCFIVEVTSEKSIDEDLHEKKDLYARLGVREYFVFDPERISLDPPLIGFRLRAGKYVAIAPEPDGSLTSQELGLRLLPEEEWLRLLDARTGKPILSSAEQAAQERKRVRQERQRAEQERQRAEQERQRAEQERQRAEALQAEVERLRAEVAAAKRKST